MTAALPLAGAVWQLFVRRQVVPAVRLGELNTFLVMVWILSIMSCHTDPTIHSHYCRRTV